MEEIDYRRFVRPYERALKQLRQELEFFVEDTGNLNVYLIAGRVKTFASAAKKACQLKLPISQMYDIAGLRVVAITAFDVEVLVRFFTRKELEKDLTVKSDTTINRKGYRTRHLVVEMPAHYTRSPYEFPVEVQLHTLLQHAFNHSSRKWAYKASYKPPAGMRAEMDAIAEQIMELDDRIGRLYESSVKTARAMEDEAPLTPSSYQIIVKERFGEDVSTEDAVDAVQYLVSYFYETNGRVRALFNSAEMNDLFDAIERATEPHLAFLKHHRRDSMGYLHVGPRMEYSRNLLTPQQPLGHEEQ